jgi:hypothetical protein
MIINSSLIQLSETDASMDEQRQDAEVVGMTTG